MERCFWFLKFLHLVRLLGFSFTTAVFLQAEELVQSGQAHQNVNNSGHRGHVAENPGDQVKIKDSDQAPVEAANDHQNEGNQA